MILLKEGKTNWKYILIIVVLAAVAGGGILWCEKKQETPFIQLPEIKKPEKTIEEVDDRILLTEKNITEIWREEFKRGNVCITFNFDPPTTEVLYSNREKGISLKIPYNPNWGNEKYKIPPYYSYEEKLKFGPLTAWEGCGWYRTYIISFISSRTAENVVASLKEEPDPDLTGYGVERHTIVRDRINDHVVVKYVYFDALCEELPIIEVIGKKYNYKFETLCGGRGVDIEFSFFENIIRTVEFIE